MSDVRLTIDASQALSQLEGVDRAVAELTRAFSEAAQKINTSFAQSNVGGQIAIDLEKGKKQADKLRARLEKIGPELTKNLSKEQVQEFAAATARAEAAVVQLDKAIVGLDPLDAASVERYEKALKEVGKSGGKLKSIEQEIKGINEQAGIGKKLFSALGGALAGAFAAIGLAEAGAQLRDLQTEINATRGELALLTNASGEALDALTASVLAMSATFNVSREEITQSVNALQGAFEGLGVEDAAAIIESGFLNGANASGEFLSVLREYPRLFDEMGFSAQEFVDIQSLAGQEGVYSDKGVDAVKEFGLRIREQTSSTKDALDAAFGSEFTKELFDGINDGSVTVKEALVQVSTQLATTEVPAKNLGTVLADVFGGAGEDAGIEFIKSLSDMGGALRDASPEAQAYTERLTAQLNAEKELAAAKITAVLALNELTEGTETFGTQAQTFGINVLSAFLKSLRPVIDAVLRLKDTFVAALESVGILGKTTGETSGVMQFLSGIFDILGLAIAGAVDSIGFLSKGFQKLFFAVPGVSSTFSFLRDVLFGIVDVISNFPAYLGGTVAAFQQAGTNISNFFSGIVTEAQIAFKQVSKLNPFGEANEQIDKEIANLRSKKAQIQASTRTLSDAFQDGFEKAKPKLEIEVAVNAKSTEDLLREKFSKLTFVPPSPPPVKPKETKSAVQIAFENREKDLALRRLLLNDLDEGLEKELEKIALHFEALKIEYEKAGLDLSTLNKNQNEAEISANAQFLFNEASAESAAEERRKKSGKAFLDVQRQELEEKKIQKEFEIDLAEENGKRLVVIAEKSGAKQADIEKLKNEFSAATQQARLTSEIEFQEALLGITDEGDTKQIDAIKRRIALLKSEFETLTASLQDVAPDAAGKKTSIWDLIGIDVSTEEGAEAARAIEETVQRSIAALQDLTAARVEAANAAVALANDNVSTQEQALETELRLAEQGFASNVSLKQRELEEGKKVQAKAIEDQRKAQRTQILLDTALQASSLATAVAKLFKSLADVPLGLGVPIAIALSATMFAAFAKSRIDALKATRARYGLSGFIGEDGIVKGRTHAQGGQVLEVERGEMFQVGDDGGRKRVEVVRRENTRKYFDLLRAANEGDDVTLASLALDLSGKAGQKEIERRARTIEPKKMQAPRVNIRTVEQRVLEKSEQANIFVDVRGGDKQVRVLESILAEMKREKPEGRKWVDEKTVRRGSFTTTYK